MFSWSSAACPSESLKPATTLIRPRLLSRRTQKKEHFHSSLFICVSSYRQRSIFIKTLDLQIHIFFTVKKGLVFPSHPFCIRSDKNSPDRTTVVKQTACLGSCRTGTPCYTHTYASIYPLCLLVFPVNDPAVSVCVMYVATVPSLPPTPKQLKATNEPPESCFTLCSTTVTAEQLGTGSRSTKTEIFQSHQDIWIIVGSVLSPFDPDHTQLLICCASPSDVSLLTHPAFSLLRRHVCVT